MIYRFNWSACCIIILIMQLFLSPFVKNAAGVLEVVGAIPKSELPNDSKSILLLVSNTAGLKQVTTGDFVSYDMTAYNQPDTPPDAATVNMTPTAPRGTLQSLTFNDSEAAPPEVDATATASQTAPTSVETATPAPGSPTQSGPPKTPGKEKLQADNRITGATVESETQNLTKLVGKPDIPVLADTDGQFVKNITENQIDIYEVTSLIDETTLSESIRVGRNFSRENLVAKARIDQAKGQTGQSLALLLPSVSVHVNSGLEISDPSVATDENGRPISSDAHSRTDASLTIRQPLFDLPSFRDWRRRKVVEQARGENYRTSDGDSYISAVNAYLSLVSTRLQTDMTQGFEAQLNELLIYVEKRAKAGAASNSDMARVRARSQATLSSRLEQESAHAAAGIEFVRLTNLVPKRVRLPALEDVDALLLPKTLDIAVAVAMQSNPEITALRAELQAAGMDQSAAKDRYLPRVDAEYTYGYALHAGGSTNSYGQRDQRIMAVLNWNLYSGGSDYNSHVERTARLKELSYRLDDQRRRVVQALSANYATLATTRERIISGYQELKSISTAAEAMSERMLSGNQSLLDLLDVYDRLYQVRSRLVSLHVLELSTVTQLVRLTLGTPEVVSEVKSASIFSTGSRSPAVPLTKN